MTSQASKVLRNLLILNYLLVVLVHLMASAVWFADKTGVLLVIGVSLLESVANAIALPVLLVVLNFRYLLRNRVPQIWGAIGLMASAVALGAVMHYLNWDLSSKGALFSPDLETILIMRAEVQVGVLVVVVLGLIAGAILTRRCKAMRWETWPPAQIRWMTVCAWTVGGLLLVSGFGLDRFLIDRYVQAQAEARKRFIDEYKPNLFALTDDKDEMKHGQYPMNVGYIFGEGPTDDYSKADMYVKDGNLVFPAGCRTSEDSRQRYSGWRTNLDEVDVVRGEILVRTRKGELFLVDSLQGSYSSAGSIEWFRFRPAPKPE